MNLSVEGFSNIGTYRQTNQDTILMHDLIPVSESVSFSLHGVSRYFVADGVGGGPAGDIASKLVLKWFNEKLPAGSYPEESEILSALHEINAEIFEASKTEPGLTGMATTLSGIFFGEETYRTVNAGDSCVLLYRDEKLSKLTIDQILPVSSGSAPITSYFGGYTKSLQPVLSSGKDMLRAGDIFMVSSDGIFRCLTLLQIEKILSNSKTLGEKASFLLNKSLQLGAPDNLSCIFIEIAN